MVKYTNMKKSQKTASSLMHKAYRDPKYSGKHVFAIAGKLYATKTGRASSNLLDKLLKKYPEETPLITYIPTEDTLILVL